MKTLTLRPTPLPHAALILPAVSLTGSTQGAERIIPGWKGGLHFYKAQGHWGEGVGGQLFIQHSLAEAFH